MLKKLLEKPSEAKDLRAFLREMRATEILEVDRPVSLEHELSAVVKQTEKYGAPAVFFSNVNGSSMPVLCGLYGTYRRIADGMGVPVEKCVELALDCEARLVPTAPVQDGPVREVQYVGDQVKVGRLPAGLHAALDGGRYITCGIVVARDPVTEKINTGIYRVMIVDDRHVTINAVENHDLGRILQEAARDGRSTDVAIVVGHHPAFAIASQLKHSTKVDSYEASGGLLGEALRVVDGLTVDLPIPVDSEIVIEARIGPGAELKEGPFGEFTYYYGDTTAPLAEVTAVSHRGDAVYNDILSTHAEHRALWLFPGREARLLSAIREVVPSAKAVRIPLHGASLSAYISIRKDRADDGQVAIQQAFAVDNYLKHVFVVDDDIDVTDDKEVLWALNVRLRPDHDLLVIPSQRGTYMDPASVRTGNGDDVTVTKLGFDATIPESGQYAGRPFPPRADVLPAEYVGLKLADYARREDLDRLIGSSEH